MVLYLRAGVFLLLAQNTLCLIPPYFYDSFGTNILFNDEGAAVETASGKDFLTGVSGDTCAEACYTIGRDYRCECCNSFAYNPSTQTCYLKKRSNEDDLSRYTASNGYQSYKFVSGVNYIYPGELPDVIQGYYGQHGYADLYTMAFISKGNNMNAINEGYTVKTSRGFDPFTNMTPAKCADECLKFTGCDGFSFNPDQDGGKCYLKTFGYPAQEKFLETKYQAEFSDGGWTYYWREGRQKFESFSQSATNLERCFCPCKKEFRCVACSESGCTENI
eukprot:TRINITY_DN7269_c1_g1_i1.p1 TRINITY_DN7269_c1_g1~~TRINITY_DN7269_c1_g1_i1.p1  ORF type:complete len:276 (-),score=28.89 TRINITY_DN7269_c1_g1_i1:100-927(-)